MDHSSILVIWIDVGLGALKCDRCELAAPQTGQVAGTSRFLPRAKLNFSDARYTSLFLDTVARVPRSGLPIQSVTMVRLRKRGNLPGLVGLTTYFLQEYQTKQKRDAQPSCSHVITFYSRLLNRLSDDAVVAVMAHELGHAWLNEHVGPEASAQREEDADILAEMWGFGPQLGALDDQTEPLRGWG